MAKLKNKTIGKKKAAPVAPAPVKARRPCFTCDGTGSKCNDCGEAEGVCECVDEETGDDLCDFAECPACGGNGVAVLDQTKAELEKTKKYRDKE